MRTRLLMCAVIVALAAAACGSDDATTVTEPAGIEPAGTAAPNADDVAADDSTTDDSAASAPVLAGPGDVPDLDMINVHTGETVNLLSLVSGRTPLLLWFWAPH